MQYFKDKTENFDDYYTCINKNNTCEVLHVYNWIKQFMYFYNKRIKNIISI